MAILPLLPLLLLLAAPPPPASAQALPPTPSAMSVCENSGGAWTPCGGTCQPTCASATGGGDGDPGCDPGSDPCVPGCECGGGALVYDPVYGCKPAAGCSPGPCCESLSATCAACAAGVSVEQYCFVFPDTPGCPEEEPPLDPLTCFFTGGIWLDCACPTTCASIASAAAHGDPGSSLPCSEDNCMPGCVCPPGSVTDVNVGCMAVQLCPPPPEEDKDKEGEDDDDGSAGGSASDPCEGVVCESGYACVAVEDGGCDDDESAGDGSNCVVAQCKPACTSTLAGDFDQDADLDVQDIVSMAVAILDSPSISSCKVQTSDLNADGIVDISDVVGVIDIAIQLKR